MFKSTDGAKTWKPSGDGLPFSVISSIAVDPTAPSTVYAGVHTFDHDGGAVFRSTDGGATWAPHSPFNFPILTLVLDPGDTRTIYAGTSKGLFRTTDGGASWSDSLLGNTNVQAFAIGETLLSGVAAGNDAFAVKLSADGSSAVYATYFGTSASDTGFGVALDAAGNVYVAGAAGAGTFAATGSAASRFAGGDSDAFVAKIAGLTVTGAAVVNNKLVVTGDGFDARAAILVDGAVQKTRGDRRSPSTQLVSKRAVSVIAPGQTVTITVRNGDGLESQPFSFTR
jgi:hypothetical protein